MSWSVFMRNPLKVSQSTSMRPLSSGSICTWVVRLLTSAMVSVFPGNESLGCKAFRPCNRRSSGKLRRSCSTVILIPVFSDATWAAFSTAHFCTGGQ